MSTGLIDTHTHLDGFFRRGELPAVLARARAANVTGMIAIGTDTDDWSLNRQLAAEHPGEIHYTVGLHPCNVGEDWAERVAQVEAFWRGGEGPCPVALGEIGLDRFHLPKDDLGAAERIFGWQREAFASGLALVRRLDCPVVVHSRGAFRECVEIIAASGVEWSRVVLHCFSEGREEMAELRRLGGCGSFTGIVTYKNAEPVRAALREQGLDVLMLETDAPYLAPTPQRGKPNEPAYLHHTAEYVAGIFGWRLDELTEKTTANARRFFRL